MTLRIYPTYCLFNLAVEIQGLNSFYYKPNYTCALYNVKHCEERTEYSIFASSDSLFLTPRENNY